MRAPRLVFCALLLASCSKHEAPASAQTIVEAPLDDGIDRFALDESVSPCTDFYAYACGNWAKRNPIPDDEGSWSRVFEAQRAANEATVRAALEDAEEGHGDGPAGDLYAACLDTTAIEARGDHELRALLASVDTSTPDAFAKSLARVHSAGSPALFDFTTEDESDVVRSTIAIVRQAPLTLPARSYFDDAALASFRSHVERTFALAGLSTKDADDAVDLERVIAGVLEPRSVFHDRTRSVTLVDASALARTQPNFRWSTYFDALGVSAPEIVHVATPAFLAKMPVNDHRWSALLRWRLLAVAFPALPASYRDEAFRFERAATGALAPHPRWKECVRFVESVAPTAVSHAFALRAPPDEGAARPIGLALIDAMAKRVGDENRKVGLVFLDEVGHAPTARFERQTFFADLLAVNAQRTHAERARIGKRTDEAPWRTPVSRANVEYEPRRDRIDVSPGFLRSPIVVDRDRTVSWATFGAVVGHEVTHAYAADGHLVNARACVDRDVVANVDEAPKVAALVEEALADRVGLRLAHDAQPHANDPIADRAFFTAYAQMWCRSFRPEAKASFVATDAHQLPDERVNQTVRDMPELASAFGCHDGDPMTRPAWSRCVLPLAP
ncbi:MAG TPA: M13 family metallopeptidase [Polyangiaceae bacterium]